MGLGIVLLGDKPNIHRFLKVEIFEGFIFLPNCYIESGFESRLQHVFSAVENYGQNQAVGGGGI